MIISFLKYGGDVGGTRTTPYEQQKDVSIIVGQPASGASGASKALEGSMEYVYYGMEIDKTLPETIVKSSSNCVMTLALGAYATTVGNTVTLLNSVKEISDEAVGEKNAKTQNCGFFPRYRIDDLEEMPTSEYIENFNINFSKGGYFEKYAKEMKYDESNPITEENIVKRASEIDYMLKILETEMSKDGMVTYDIENAVRRMK